MKKPINNKKSNNIEKDIPERVILKTELTKQQREEIKEVFDSIDTDNSGFLEINELISAVNSLGLDNNSNEINRIMTSLDMNKDGKVSFDEFISLINVQLTENNFEDQMKRIFSSMCGEENEKLKVERLKQLCVDLGEEITDDEIKEMIEEADLNKDGEVDDSEFMNLMKKLNVL